MLAGIYGRERQQGRRRRPGKGVQRILAALGRSEQVLRVSYEMDRARWVVSIELAGDSVDVAVPLELADDFLDSSLREPAKNLKMHVARDLGMSGSLARP